MIHSIKNIDNLNIISLSATKSDVSKRLDLFISENTGITRSQVQKFIKKGLVFVNNRVENQNYKLKANDAVLIYCHKKEPTILIPEPLPLKIFFKDDYIAVVDKPAGMVVYPSFGHETGTLMNALLYHCHKIATVGGPLRPGIVHRLDKDTSGVMVIALDDMAYYNLIEQFRNRTINRKYIALVYGTIKDESGEIILSIGRSLTDRKKMSTKTKRGKEAITRWKVIQRFDNATLIEVRLGTGRTHQIRVHFSAIGHPVLGDKTYGKKSFIEINKRKILFLRQMLHAEELGFIHPITKKYMEFRSPMPEDMEECIRKLSMLS